jgi:hypothetical protein
MSKNWNLHENWDEHGHSPSTRLGSGLECWSLTESNRTHLGTFQGTATVLRLDQIPQIVFWNQAHKAGPKTQQKNSLVARHEYTSLNRVLPRHVECARMPPLKKRNESCSVTSDMKVMSFYPLSSRDCQMSWVRSSDRQGCGEELYISDQ